MKMQELQRSEIAQATVLNEQLRREIRVWKRKHADALEQIGDRDARLKLIEGVNLENTAPTVIEPMTRSHDGEAVALAAGGDWHVYERVRSREVNGMNVYNKTVAHHSISNFARGIVRWVEIHRSGTNIHTLILSLLGDLMTNQLHEDQMETNTGTPQEELLFLYEHIIGLLDFLVKHGGFKRIYVECSDGNHGRDTDRIRKANRVRHSHEWLLYKLLEKHYLGNKIIRFHVADGYHLYYSVFGRWVRQHHGDAIKYQGGVGGPTISIRKAIAEWNKGRVADFDVFGHFHQRIMDSRFLANGCILGYNAYAESIKAAFEEPSQSLILLDKKRWITADNRIFVR